MKTAEISKEIIRKIVTNSQKIEGYKPAPKRLKQQAKELMIKYNVKISA